MPPLRVLIPVFWGGIVLTSAAHAEEPSGPELALRAGYALPLGEASDGQALNDTLKGVVPLGAELGFRFAGGFGLAVYGDYAFGMLTDSADAACATLGAECSASRLRLGLQGLYHFKPGATLDPWLGLGLGYEALVTETGPSQTSTLSGFEFVNAQVGLDLFADRSPVSFGPFAQISLAQYSSSKLELSTTTRSTSIDATALHAWLQFGLRVALLWDISGQDHDTGIFVSARADQSWQRSMDGVNFREPLKDAPEPVSPQNLASEPTTAQGEAALLGARRDLRYAGKPVARCECLALALGSPGDANFGWDGPRPSIDPRTQLVLALSADGVACARASEGALGASYAGYTQQGADVIVEIEAAAPGLPLVQGAVIPLPGPGGSVYLRPRAGVIYGRPLGTDTGQCQVLKPEGGQR